MYIFDSVKRQKVKFIPLNEERVKIYVCGPTVYDDAHLGHARSAVAFDLLRRTFEAKNYSVTFAKNFTDIDDKIIKKMEEQNRSLEDITDEFTNSYLKDMEALGIKRADLEPKATDNIDAMTKMISSLVSKEKAYEVKGGDIYFNTSKDSSYFSLSGRLQDETQSRIKSVSEKLNSADFALWKASGDSNKVSFNSPFGAGRPGWHIECSAMIEEHLAEDGDNYAIDIHGGGADLLFPHHENEAAQTRCATNHELAKYWMHNGFVNIDGEKMSKSLGNSFFIKDALKIYSGETLRNYLLGTHYRQDFNFNERDLLQSKTRLDKLYRLKKRVFQSSCSAPSESFKLNLIDSLSDDLNISVALSIVDNMITKINDKLDKEPKNSNIKKTAQANIELVETLLGIGGSNPFEHFQYGVDEALKERIEGLIKRRDAAKKSKDFKTADIIRDEILAEGISIMDSASGTFWEKI